MGGTFDDDVWMRFMLRVHWDLVPGRKGCGVLKQVVVHTIGS